MTAAAPVWLPLAHAQGTLLDLPVDAQLVLLVAGAAVVVTATWLVRRDGATQDPPVRRSPPASRLLTRAVDSRVVRLLLKAAGLAGFAVVLALAVAGPPRGDRSALPRLVVVVIWGGVLASSVLLGPWYRAVDPLRTVAAGLGRLAGLAPRALPEALGRWPAAAGCLLAAGLGLTALDSPAVVGAAVLAYVAVHLLAGIAWGSAWFDRAEALTVVSDLAGRVAVVGRRADGLVGLRDPVLETLRDPAAPGTLAVVAAVAGAAVWEAAAEALGPSAAGSAATVLGLLLSAAALGSLLRLARPQPFLTTAFLPLAAAYGVLLVGVPLLLDGQIALSLLTDPLGTAPAPPRLAAEGALLPVDSAVVAAVQTAIFVACHTLGVAVAHRSALARYDLRGARAVMFPVRVLLVGSVVAGLWLPTLGS